MPLVPRDYQWALFQEAKASNVCPLLPFGPLKHTATVHCLVITPVASFSGCCSFAKSIFLFYLPVYKSLNLAGHCDVSMWRTLTKGHVNYVICSQSCN